MRIVVVANAHATEMLSGLSGLALYKFPGIRCRLNKLYELEILVFASGPGRFGAGVRPNSHAARRDRRDHRANPKIIWPRNEDQSFGERCEKAENHRGGRGH